MKTLTKHEEKILNLVRQYPDIVKDRIERERVAELHGISEKTLRNRIGDLKRYHLIEDSRDIQISENIDKSFSNIEIIWKRRKFIILNTFGFAVLSIIISLYLPKWYASQAVIISSGSSTTNFLSMLSGMPIGDFGLSPLNEDINNYIAILESRSVRGRIVNQFDLTKRYNAKDIELASLELANNVELKVSEEGTLVITVLDKDPTMARDINLALLNELDLVNRRISSEKGKFNRQFLEERLNQNRIDLAQAEENLKLFQQEYGVVDVPSQISADIEIYAQLYALRVDAEVKLKVSEATYTAKDPKIQQIKILINELDYRLDELTIKGGDRKVLLAFNDLPELGLRYARFFREVEIQGNILEFILPQYEQAKMEESKNIPTVQIIDEPNIAINKTKPSRVLIVISTTLMAFIISVVYVSVAYSTRDLRARLKYL